MKGKHWYFLASVTSLCLTLLPILIECSLDSVAEKIVATSPVVGYSARDNKIRAELANGETIAYRVQDLNSKEKKLPQLGESVKHITYTEETQKKIEVWRPWQFGLAVVFGSVFFVLLIKFLVEPF